MTVVADRTEPPPLYVESYLQRYRAQIPVRLVQVGLAAAGTAFFWSVPLAVVFLAVHYSLYGALIWVVKRGQAQLGEPENYPRLKRRTAVLTFLIGAHISSLSLLLFYAEGGRFQHVSLLLAIALLMLAGLQVHMSRVGFLIGVLPQTATLICMGLYNGKPVDPTTMFGTIMFICCVVAASWRQQSTDRQATELRVEQATQNARLQAALEEAERERARAEDASRAKSHVLTVASHEIRTPLNVVLGFAEALRRDAQTESQRGHADGIKRAGAILLRLLNAVLDMAKAEAGHAQLRVAPLSPATLLSDVSSVWTAPSAERGITVRTEIAPEAAALFVASDFTKIEQTLVNLLSNAIKLSEPGEIVVALQAREQAAGEALVRFEVADRGPGVRPEDRERIFAPFEQTEAGTARGGTGLGLAICRSNVELLGGRIDVGAREGGGAVFWFDFPAAIAEAPADESAQEEADFSDGRPLRVLLAEDNPANRQVVELLLEPTGCDITFAENGQEAIDAYMAGPFDVIFMDAMMPVMDGITAISHIRRMETGPRTPIYMLTANIFSEDIRSYEAAGADGVVKKPIQVSELYAALSAAAAAAEAEPQAAVA